MPGDLTNLGSELSSLILAGRALRSAMPQIIHESSSSIIAMEKSFGGDPEFSETSELTKLQVVLAISEVLQEEDRLFL